MIVQCQHCQSTLEIDARKLGKTPRKVRCSFCHTLFQMAVSGSAEEPDALAGHSEQAEENALLMGTMIRDFGRKSRQTAGHVPVDGHADHGQVKKVLITPQKKAELLLQSRWLEALDWHHLRLFAPSWELYKIAARTSLFRMGDRNPNLGLIIRGQVQISYDDGDSYDQNLATLGPGQSLGELSLLDDQPRTTDAITLCETFLFVLTRERWEQLADQDSATHRQVLMILTRRLCRALRSARGLLVDFLPP